jgi:acyl-CoA thioesterase-1
MKRLSAMLFFAAATIGSSCEAKNIIILGDSLGSAYGVDPRLRWSNFLQYGLGADHSVWNASKPGRTTHYFARQIEDILGVPNADLLLLIVGGADGIRGLDTAAMQQNLGVIISAAQKRGIDVVLMQIELPPIYGAAYSQQFSQVYTKVAQDHSIDVIEFFMDEMIHMPILFQADGIHPSWLAQPILAARVLNALQPHL